MNIIIIVFLSLFEKERSDVKDFKLNSNICVYFTIQLKNKNLKGNNKLNKKKLHLIQRFCVLLGLYVVN